MAEAGARPGTELVQEIVELCTPLAIAASGEVVSVEDVKNRVQEKGGYSEEGLETVRQHLESQEWALRFKGAHKELAKAKHQESEAKRAHTKATKEKQGIQNGREMKNIEAQIKLWQGRRDELLKTPTSKVKVAGAKVKKAKTAREAQERQCATLKTMCEWALDAISAGREQFAQVCEGCSSLNTMSEDFLICHNGI